MIHVASKDHRGKYSNAKTGKFIMKHPAKFCGSCQPQYKSSLEKIFMMYADRNPAIVQWGYETAAPVKYLDRSSNPPKVRRYYVDFVCKIRVGSMVKTVWIEIKPKSETVAPKRTASPRTIALWVKNSCKWQAARAVAKSLGYEFKILTEDQLC